MVQKTDIAVWIRVVLALFCALLGAVAMWAAISPVMLVKFGFFVDGFESEVCRWNTVAGDVGALLGGYFGFRLRWIWMSVLLLVGVAGVVLGNVLLHR